MSRPLIIVVALLVVLVVAGIGLASVDTEVAPQIVRKPVLTQAPAK